MFRASDLTSVIGGCGLHRRIGAGGIDIGYWIHVDAIGNGYATELAGALTRVALPLTDVDRVEIHCDKANVRSAAVPRKLGYVLDRIENDDIEAPGETGRSMIWVMRAAEALDNGHVTVDIANNFAGILQAAPAAERAKVQN